LSFAGGGIPAISFRDWSGATTVPPGYVPSNAWGIAVQDVDGCLTGGTPPANKESPFWPGVTPHTLVTNHPMMHLTSGTKTPDLQAPYLPANSNAWLSPFRWAHFQVRWYQQTYTLMWLETELPPVTFTRQEHQGWPGRAFAASTPQSLHMRQLPVIVKPANTQAEECVYVLDLEVRVSTPAVGPLANRVDVAVDDATPGDITRVHIVPPPALANWTPTLRVNDNPAFVNHNGANPLPPTVLSPGLSSGPTSYQMITVNGRQAIDLRMVNVNRTHRITITW
jgi:hypothetical protein